MTQIKIKRDTSAWVFQVWASFVIAVGLCAYGVWNLPGSAQDRVFLTMGFFFCLSSSFVLAKCLRDNQYQVVDTPMWRGQVWAAFFLAVLLTAWGLQRMALQSETRDYMLAAWLFLVSATFTLTKTIRDGHEADKLEREQQGFSGEYEALPDERGDRVELQKRER
jgi:hypothetical protein